MRRRRVNAAGRVVALIAVGACLPAWSAGCRPEERPAASFAREHAGSYPRFVQDTDGRRVALPRFPERIVSLSPAHTETLFALGLGGRLVAADTFSDYPPEARGRAVLACFPHPPLEQIVALKPDLVLVLTEGAESVGRMESAGLTVVKLFPRSFEEAMECIRTIGLAAGVSETAINLVVSLRTRAARLRKKIAGAPRPRVLLELDASVPGRPFVAGGGGLYGDLLRAAGGDNVFGDLPQPAEQVSFEQVLARDPEVILLGDTLSPNQPQSAETVRARPGWSQLTAVRNGRVHPIQSERITRPGPRLVDGLEELASRIHPDLFPESPRS